MQRYRYTIAALFIFAVLLAWVLTAERGRVPEKGEVFAVQTSQVSKLEVERADKKIALEKRGEDWYLTAPILGLANKQTVENMVRAVAQLKSEAREDADVTNPDYGLQQPVMTVVFTGGRQTPTTIKVGAATPVGGKYFATISGRPQLYLIPLKFKIDLEKDPDELRETNLAPGLKTEDVQEVSIKRGELTIVAQKAEPDKPDSWWLRQPVEAKADRWALESVINAGRDGEVRDLEQPAEDMSKFGLDQPQAVVTLELKNKKTIRVQIGKETEKEVKKPFSEDMETKELVYTQSEGRPEVLLVAADLLANVSRDVVYLRDKHFVELNKADVVEIKVQRKKGLSFEAAKVGDEWVLKIPAGIEPYQAKIDDIIWDMQDLAATEFVDEQPDDLAQYGLTLPHTVVTLTLKEQRQPLKISFGNLGPERVGYYCRTSQSQQVYLVSDLVLNGLPADIADLKVERSSSDEAD